MSGHSKWVNIRIRKQSQDARKGKLFAKVAREIIVAARQGGGNPDVNHRLRFAIEKARDVSMPIDNIKRAVQRGTGEIAGVSYDEVTYEGYGPGGVAILIRGLTDNRNRTVSEIRRTLAKNGGRLGESNCVAWMFDPRGVITLPRRDIEEDALLELALETGAQDVRTEGDTYEVICPPSQLDTIRQALLARGLTPASAEVTMLPQTRVSLDGSEAHQVLRLMDQLEDLEDVQQVYANFDIPDALLQEAAA
jgi:YebC/PmpR family DNA-binding regulatory protein